MRQDISEIKIAINGFKNDISKFGTSNNTKRIMDRSIAEENKPEYRLETPSLSESTTAGWGTASCTFFGG